MNTPFFIVILCGTLYVGYILGLYYNVEAFPSLRHTIGKVCYVPIFQIIFFFWFLYDSLSSKDWSTFKTYFFTPGKALVLLCCIELVAREKRANPHRNRSHSHTIRQTIERAKPMLLSDTT